MAGEQDIGLISSMENAFDIVQDADLPRTTRGVYVGGTGTLRVRMAGGAEVTFAGLAAGRIHWLRITRVYSAATSATGLIGLV